MRRAWFALALTTLAFGLSGCTVYSSGGYGPAYYEPAPCYAPPPVVYGPPAVFFNYHGGHHRYHR